MEDTARRSHDSTLPYGDRIRHLRRKEGMTLQALADRAGISVGFLSQVERDLASPSLSTLSALATVLEVGVDHFIATPNLHDAVTRQSARARFSPGRYALTYEALTTNLPGGVVSSLIVHFPPYFRSETSNLPGEEIVMVLEGQLRHSTDGTAIDLATGDSLHFMGDRPHSFENAWDQPTRVLWAGTSNPFKAYPDLTNGSVPKKTTTPEPGAPTGE